MDWTLKPGNLRRVAFKWSTHILSKSVVPSDPLDAQQGTAGPGVGRAAGRGVGGAAASQPGLFNNPCSR